MSKKKDQNKRDEPPTNKTKKQNIITRPNPLLIFALTLLGMKISEVAYYRYLIKVHTLKQDNNPLFIVKSS